MPIIYLRCFIAWNCPGFEAEGTRGEIIRRNIRCGKVVDQMVFEMHVQE